MMSTYIQMVSKKEIDELKTNPALINGVEKLEEELYSTYFADVINYFICGDAYPDPKKNLLGGMFFGNVILKTPTLENGEFGIIEPNQIKNIVENLKKINLDEIKKKIEKASAKEMRQHEVESWKLLNDGGDPDPEKTIIANIESLINFYQNTEKKKLGVVMYSS